jgi:mannitol-1-phosphate/altronate dehydrogenase
MLTANNDPHINHVHIGAGSFGLGMVVDICDRASFRTAVITKWNNKEHQRLLRVNPSYTVLYDDNPNTTKQLTPMLHIYEHESDAKLLDLLANPSVVLITTSVRKENLLKVAPLLAKAFERRTAGKSNQNVCVMACENLPQNSSELKRLVVKLLGSTALDYVHSKVSFCNTVVDRVCAPVRCRSNSVQVPVETFHHWVIHKPALEQSAIQNLEKYVKVAQTEIEFQGYEVQKYWCMNGLHLAAAAYLYNYEPKLLYLADALEISFLLTKLQALERELEAAFALYTNRLALQRVFSPRHIREYGDTVLRRLRQNRADTVERILKQEQTPGNSTLEILDRIERLTAPHCEILAHYKGLIEPRPDLIASHSETKRIARLQLDDAILQVVLAMRRFAYGFAGLET